MFCQLPEGLKTLYDPCARATSREKVAPIWMGRNKWVTEVIALLIRFIGAPFIIRAHLVWKGGQDLTAAFCKLRLLATTKPQLPTAKKSFARYPFTPMFQGNEEEEEGGSGSMSSLAFLREKAHRLRPGERTKRMRISIDLLRKISVVNHHYFSPPFGGFLKWWYPPNHPF